MKKFLLLLFLFSCYVSNIDAQSYRSFPSSDAMWRERSGEYWCNCCRDYQVTIDGDTIISGITYHKLKWAGIIYGSPDPATAGPFWSSYYGCHGAGIYSYYYQYNYSQINYYGAFREDAVNKKVYFIPPSESTDTLLYDFNLNVGDTLPETYVNYSWGPGHGNVVGSIDSVLIGSIYHKRFNIINTPSGSPTTYVSLIEGMGSTFGLLGMLMVPFEAQNVLDCFTDTSGNYTSPGYFCTMLSVGINEPLKFEDKVSVYPNPGDGKFRLDMSTIPSGDLAIDVMNILGKSIMKKDLKGMLTEIDITDQPNGVYFIRISDSKGNSATKKIVKQ